MNVVAVSQQVTVGAYGDRLDALDQSWTTLLEEADLTPLPIPNRCRNVVSLLDRSSVSGLILTGGNDLGIVGGDATERDETELCALRHAVAHGLPVLGVCRGAQLVVHAFGGRVVAVEGHAGTCHALEARPTRFGQIPGAVRSYHNFGFVQGDMPEALSISATAPDGGVESVEHRTLPLLAVMWHPERDQAIRTVSIAMLRRLFVDGQ